MSYQKRRRWWRPRQKKTTSTLPLQRNPASLLHRPPVVLLSTRLCHLSLQRIMGKRDYDPGTGVFPEKQKGRLMLFVVARCDDDAASPLLDTSRSARFGAKRC